MTRAPFLQEASEEQKAPEEQKDLNRWIEEGVDPERRAEAANRMLINQAEHGTSLDLSDLNLLSIPAFIKNLPWLERLDLTGNHLSTLSDSITKLPLLKYLDLSYNQFKTIPDAIGKLPSLKHLYLAGNQLSTISDSIEKLDSLEVLALSKNKLQTLPLSLLALQNLKFVALQKNSSPEISQIKNCEQLRTHLESALENSISIMLRGIGVENPDSPEYQEKLKTSFEQLSPKQKQAMSNRYFTDKLASAMEKIYKQRPTESSTAPAAPNHSFDEQEAKGETEREVKPKASTAANPASFPLAKKRNSVQSLIIFLDRAARGGGDW